MDENNIPAHVAIIMDGNGRWAKQRGLPRNAGHAEGCRVIEQIVEDAARLGIQYLTVYAFSTENWKRSEDEISTLMQLFRYYGRKLQNVASENNVRVLTIGERSRFPKDIIDEINDLEDSTKDNTGLTFVLAANYGGRDEIRRAVVHMLDDQAAGKLDSEQITEDLISSYLDTSGIPDPDLLIRTSGEERISNFLLWQSAYTEFYFSDVLWPDFSRDELVKAIESYQGRDRRYGGA